MTGLKPVSFSKKQAPEPRISAPYVPGRHNSRDWTEAEKQVLLDHFEKRGGQFCQPMLPNRSLSGIYGMAHKLGLKFSGHEEHKRRKGDYPAIDAAIRDEWHMLSGKGAINAFAARIGHPRWLVSKRARVLGFAMPHRKEPDWSVAEIALMAKVPLHDDCSEAAEIFRAHGFHRTGTAIRVKAKRLGLARRYNETLTATAAAKIVGFSCTKTLTAYIQEGRLRATRRKTRRTIQQGGDHHSITREDLRQFIIDNLERIDFRKVDKFELVAILTMPVAAAGEAKAGAA